MREELDTSRKNEQLVKIKEKEIDALNNQVRDLKLKSSQYQARLKESEENCAQLEAIIAKLEARKDELKYESECALDQLNREKETFQKAEEKWRSRAELMKKLEDQIRAISTSNLAKEKEMKTKLDANNRTVVEAKQAEMEALEKLRGKAEISNRS